MIGHRTLSDAVARSIIRDLRDGKYRAGDQLPTLKELMAVHQIGYGVAREAMQQLVALGLVDIRPRRGAIVRAVDPTGLDDRKLAVLLTDQAIGELYDLRALIEIAVAGEAAQIATDDQIAEIQDLHQAYQEACAAGQPVFQIDVDLHTAIARASGNALFLRVLHSLRDVLSEVRAEAGRVPGADKTAIIEHEAVIHAVASHDPGTARAAMRRHIQTAKTTVLRARSE